MADLGINSFEGIIDFSGSLGKISKPWHHALAMYASNLRQFGVNAFSDIIAFEGAVIKIGKPWNHAVAFSASLLADFGVIRL